MCREPDERTYDEIERDVEQQEAYWAIRDREAEWGSDAEDNMSDTEDTHER